MSGRPRPGLHWILGDPFVEQTVHLRSPLWITEAKRALEQVGATILITRDGGRPPLAGHLTGNHLVTQVRSNWSRTVFRGDLVPAEDGVELVGSIGARRSDWFAAIIPLALLGVLAATGLVRGTTMGAVALGMALWIWLMTIANGSVARPQRTRIHVELRRALRATDVSDQEPT